MIPANGSIWRHTSGIKYRVLFLANVGSHSHIYPTMVVYENAATLRKFARELKDWPRSFTAIGRNKEG